jgi:predicted Co/Zn/Cd cation transporter (cation efflux family)
VPAVITVAAVGVALLAALAVFQLALVAGAPLGRFAWGGQHVVLPPRLRAGSVVSVVLYALFALLMLQAAGATSLLPDGVAAVGIWVLTGYLALGVALNAISRSRPERLVMTPVALVLLAVCLVLALG